MHDTIRPLWSPYSHLMTILSIDFETQSPVDLPKTGVYPYAAHPKTRILCMAYAFDDEEPRIWYPDDTNALPAEVSSHFVGAGGEIRAWNAQFERTIINHLLTPWQRPRLEQFKCTAAEAAAMSLPRHLGQCANVLGVAAKDDEGAALMRKMSKTGYQYTRDELERLGEYCKQDVRVEHAIYKKLRRLGDDEQEIYWLDQRMNDRGIRVDTPLIEAAKVVVLAATEQANATMSDLTLGKVGAVTQVGQMKKWLASRGILTTSLSKQTVTELLNGDLPDDVRGMLGARQEAGRSSIAKLDPMLMVSGRDSTLRGLLLYHGAGTGRWSGKLVQPQNFPRGKVKVTDAVLDRIRAGTASIEDVSSSLRSMLVARAGQALFVGDYSAIEARVLVWLAHDEPALAVFAAGEDPYKHMASAMTGVPYAEITDAQRQSGKAAELGCGFQMAGEKFEQAAYDVYGVVVPPGDGARIVKLYRDRHPAVKAYWYEVQDAALDAVRTPGVKFVVRDRVTFRMVGNFLWVILPSGRPLCYPAPKIKPVTTQWCRLKNQNVMRWRVDLTPEEIEIWTMTRDQLSFGSVDAKTRAWERESTYGGKLVENIVQAVARDLMACAMLRLESRGYLPLLSVHDEIICESGTGTVTEYLAVMSTLPAWAAGCPVKAEGWTGPRYRK